MNTVLTGVIVIVVALALVAIVGAGLFARSFQLARQIRPGFDPGHVLVANLSLTTAGYAIPDLKQFCVRLRGRLESQPGIAGVTYADHVPMGFDSGPWEELEIEGYKKGRGENMQIYRNVVAPGYFKVLGIPLLLGRDFTEQDDLSKTAKPVMIVNETFARRYFGGGCDFRRSLRHDSTCSSSRLLCRVIFSGRRRIRRQPVGKARVRARPAGIRLGGQREQVIEEIEEVFDASVFLRIAMGELIAPVEETVGGVKA